MRQILFSTTAVLFLFATHLSAQNKTYFGIEAAVTSDTYEIIDNEDNLEADHVPASLWGFNLRQDINNYVFLETGLIKKYYRVGFQFKDMNWGGSLSVINAWLIPLRLGTKINLCKEKFYLVPVVGYSFCSNSYYGSHRSSSGQVISSSDTFSFEYAKDNSVRQFSLLQTSLGFEFKFFKTAMLSASASYYTGFKTIDPLDISFTNNNSPISSGKAVTRGEFWSFGIGLKYPVSNLWTKKT